MNVFNVFRNSLNIDRCTFCFLVIIYVHVFLQKKKRKVHVNIIDVLCVLYTICTCSLGYLLGVTIRVQVLGLCRIDS